MTSSHIPAFTGRARDELGTLVKLAFPISLAQVSVVAMGLVDTAIVGHTSPYDLGATAMGRSISFAALSVCMGVVSSIEPLSAQALGGSYPRRAYSALRVALRVALALAVPTVLVCFALTFLLARFGVDAAFVPRVQAYLLGSAPGTFFFVAYLAAKTFLQTHNDTRPALLASVAANALNLVACGLLVLGDGALAYVGLPALGLPRLGPFGAGLATSLSSALLALWVLRAARRYRPLDDGPELATPGAYRTSHGALTTPWAPVRVREVLSLGVPAGLQLLAEIGAFSFAAVLAGRLGAVAVSAHQVAVGLATFTFMAAFGVSGATATRVGHAIGARVAPGRVGALGMALGVAIMGASATVFSLAGPTLVGFFTSDPQVVAVGAQLVGIAALFQLFDGLQVVAAGALRGAGDVRFPFLANVVAHWMVGFPLAVWLAFYRGLGAQGLWWGLTAGLVAVSLALSWRFARVARKHRAVGDEPGGSDRRVAELA